MKAWCVFVLLAGCAPAITSTDAGADPRQDARTGLAGVYRWEAPGTPDPTEVRVTINEDLSGEATAVIRASCGESRSTATWVLRATDGGAWTAEARAPCSGRDVVCEAVTRGQSCRVALSVIRTDGLAFRLVPSASGLEVDHGVNGQMVLAREP
jgi:hypothetical protein